MSNSECPAAVARSTSLVARAVRDRDKGLRTLLEAVRQQIFVLRPDFTTEYANQAILDYHGDAPAAALFSSGLLSLSCLTPVGGPMPDDPKSGPPKPTRRAFLVTTGSTAAATVVATRLLADATSAVEQGRSAMETANPPKIASAVPVVLRINGTDHRLRIDPRTTLLDCLRETVALTGTKKGCDHGQCGACTVHVNGRRVTSCLTLALMHEGDEITTIEGIGTPDALHPMQAAFVAFDGYQCGYCTSGQIMSAVALLKEPCGPDDAAVKELMSGNICRCGAYAGIVAAIQQVRKNKNR